MGKQWLKWDSKKWLTLLQLFQFCSLIITIGLLKVSWLYEMQLSNQIWGHSEYGADLFFELKLVSPFNSVESWLVNSLIRHHWKSSKWVFFQFQTILSNFRSNLIHFKPCKPKNRPKYFWIILGSYCTVLYSKHWMHLHRNLFWPPLKQIWYMLTWCLYSSQL